MKASEWIKEIQKEIEEHGDLELKIGSMDSSPEDFGGIDVWGKEKGEPTPIFVLI